MGTVKVLVIVLGLTLLPVEQLSAQQPKTGVLKNGETCEILPCTCGNVSATAVGCTCELGSLGPSNAIFTCPTPTALPNRSGFVWVAVAVLAIVAILIYVRTKRKPQGASGGGSEGVPRG